MGTEANAGRMTRVQHFGAPLPRWRRRRLALALSWLLAGPVAAQSLALHYQERPPYSRSDGAGQVSGLVATPAANALTRAGISYRWTLTPNQRQIALMQQGEGLHCGVGWFRTPERAALGKFSQPLYRDQPFAALARTDAPLRDGMRASEALAAAGTVLLVKEGYSYGPVLDPLLADVATLRTPAEVPQMVRMLAAGRAAWMIVTREEARELLAPPELAQARLRVLTLADVPAGQTRHLYCSKAVPDDWIARIDRALGAQRR